MHDILLYVISAIIVLGVFAQWLSWRLKLPAILALLVIGIVAGPMTGLLRLGPDRHGCLDRGGFLYRDGAAVCRTGHRDRADSD